MGNNLDAHKQRHIGFHLSEFYRSISAGIHVSLPRQLALEMLLCSVLASLGCARRAAEYTARKKFYKFINSHIAKFNFTKFINSHMYKFPHCQISKVINSSSVSGLAVRSEAGAGAPPGLYMYRRVSISIYLSLYIYIYIYIQRERERDLSLYIYIYICVYIYIYIYISGFHLSVKR